MSEEGKGTGSLFLSTDSMLSISTDPELRDWLRWGAEGGNTPIFVCTVAGRVGQGGVDAFEAHGVHPRRRKNGRTARTGDAMEEHLPPSGRSPTGRRWFRRSD